MDNALKFTHEGEVTLVVRNDNVPGSDAAGEAFSSSSPSLYALTPARCHKGAPRFGGFEVGQSETGPR
jgi:hypothetical protein